MTTTQTLCYNCFQQVTDPSQPCPHCGFDLRENREKFPVALQAGTVLNNRYIVGRVLGQGGFGITYVAFDTQLQAKVAVKEYMPGEMATRVEGTTVSVMAGTRADDFAYGAERFQEEARTLAKFIGHPNIAGVSSYFDENDTSYFVMDYIEGVSFKTYIANNGGKVSVDETLNVMIPVLRALTAVHAEGFIHRDVTPDNIYISKDGNVKLLDFGSARYSIGDKSKSLDVILKVGYAPKEQYIRRGRQGPYTDVYSCAACFYAALTGYLPPESLERLDHDELVPVSQVAPDIPEWLDKAILKGLAVQPEDRFQSAAEFLDAIENQLVVDVPSAGGSAPAQPEKKKPKTALVAGIAAALVVAVGLGVFLGGRGGGEPTAPVSGENAGISETSAGQQEDGDLPPLKQAEVPSVTILGEEYSTDLRELDLREAGIGLSNEDIEPLRYMINLTSLRLPAQSQISDLSPLANLTELRSLNLLSGNWGNNPICNISDLTPLAGLTNLTSLSILAGPLDSLAPLAGLTNLTSLEIYAMSYPEDMTPISGLTNLKTLDLGTVSGSRTFMQDLTAFSGLTQLQELTMDAGNIASFHGIETLTDLRSFESYGSGEGVGYTNVDAFAGLTKLQSLRLPFRGGSDEQPYDIQGLAGLTELRSLDMPAGAKDLTPLAGMTKLQSLRFSSSGSIEGMDTDLAPLENLTELTSLTIQMQGEGLVIDLAPLAGMTKLQALDLQVSSWGNWQNPQPSLKNFSVVSNFTDLRSLTLYATHFSDISPLRNLEKLQTFTVYGDGGDITDWSPVDHVPVVTRN